MTSLGFCKVGKNAAYEIMHRAGAIKLGRGLRLRPQDLEAYLAGLAGGGSNVGSNRLDISPQSTPSGGSLRV
jgi:hypothetical protein